MEQKTTNKCSVVTLPSIFRSVSLTALKLDVLELNQPTTAIFSSSSVLKRCLRSILSHNAGKQIISILSIKVQTQFLVFVLIEEYFTYPPCIQFVVLFRNDFLGLETILSALSTFRHAHLTVDDTFAHKNLIRAGTSHLKAATVITDIVFCMHR